MTEEKFYDAVEKMAKATLPSGMGNYYPTVDEIKEHISGHALNDFIPILLFYASDPLHDTLPDNLAYNETVKCAKELTSKIDLKKNHCFSTDSTSLTCTNIL